MAGLGLGPADFALFEIDDPDERADALERTLLPKLVAIGEGCQAGLGRVVARALHLHARVAVKGESARRATMRVALEREAGNLARKGKPFRRLRPYHGWNHEELPELAPAHSAAFWTELSDELAPGREGIDVGVSWTREEARSLAVGDLLGVFRDLAPLYKLLAAAE